MTTITSPASISIVLPVFMRHADNTSIHLLRRAIESALDQTYPDEFEILIVDDGSPVPVQLIMREAEMPESVSIRWLRNERNEGLIHALNKGLQEARYTLVARLDADDRWLPGKIARQVDLFGSDSELSLVAASMSAVDAKGKMLSKHIHNYDWKDILYHTTKFGNVFPHGSVVALASIYRLLGGYSHDPAFTHCEDYHLWSIWIRFFKSVMTGELFYEYRQASGTISDIYKKQQSYAAHSVKRRLSIADWSTLPEDMRRLAAVLGVTLIQCGVICYRIWQFRPTVKMPGAAVGVLRRILPDRDFVIDDDDRPPIYEIEKLAKGFPDARASGDPKDNIIMRVI